jgi:hypothetical protein
MYNNEPQRLREHGGERREGRREFPVSNTIAVA